MKLTGDIRCDFEKVTAENVKLKDRILGYLETISSLRHSLKTAQKSKDLQRADYEELLAQKDAVIKELENRLAHELALKGHDGTNTGTPTAQTPVGKRRSSLIPEETQERKKADSQAMKNISSHRRTTILLRRSLSTVVTMDLHARTVAAKTSHQPESQK